eukprot:1066735-Pelagomonas_calceolata.AAC.1
MVTNSATQAILPGPRYAYAELAPFLAHLKLKSVVQTSIDLGFNDPGLELASMCVYAHLDVDIDVPHYPSCCSPWSAPPMEEGWPPWGLVGAMAVKPAGPMEAPYFGVYGGY